MVDRLPTYMTDIEDFSEMVEVAQQKLAELERYEPENKPDDDNEYDMAEDEYKEEVENLLDYIADAIGSADGRIEDIATYKDMLNNVYEEVEWLR